MVWCCKPFFDVMHVEIFAKATFLSLARHLLFSLTKSATMIVGSSWLYIRVFYILVLDVAKLDESD